VQDNKTIEIIEIVTRVATNTDNLIKRFDNFESKHSEIPNVVTLMTKRIEDCEKTDNEHETRIKALEDERNFNWVNEMKKGWMGKIFSLGFAVFIIALIAMVVMQFYSFQEILKKTTEPVPTITNGGIK
jgi:hypothetical protein